MTELRMVVYGPKPDRHKDGCYCCGDTYQVGKGNRGWCDKCNHDAGACCHPELWEDEDD